MGLWERLHPSPLWGVGACTPLPLGCRRKPPSQIRPCKLQFVSCKLQHTTSNLQQTFITTAIKVTSCKEMGGATSHALQSGACSLSKRLIPSTGRYAVTGCKLQVHNVLHAQYYANVVYKTRASLVELLAIKAKFYHSCEPAGFSINFCHWCISGQR